jgi:hypothetical protein
LRAAFAEPLYPQQGQQLSSSASWAQSKLQSVSSSCRVPGFQLSNFFVSVRVSSLMNLTSV